jgi:hypothetical protein
MPRARVLGGDRLPRLLERAKEQQYLHRPVASGRLRQLPGVDALAC